MEIQTMANREGPDHVAIGAESSDDELLITIEDRGPGIPPEIMKSLGKTHKYRGADRLLQHCHGRDRHQTWRQ